MHQKKQKNLTGVIPERFVGYEYLDPTYDPAFHAFFDSEKALVHFLNGLLHLEGNQKIKHLTYHMEETVQFQIPESMTYRFDIRAITEDGRHLDIEMQRARQSNLVDRMREYNSLLNIKAKKENEKMRNVSVSERKIKNHLIPEVISIWICNFNLIKDTIEYIDEWAMYSKNQLRKGDCKPIMNKNKYIIVELPKFKKRVSELDNIGDIWIYLLKHLCEKQPKLPINIVNDSVFNEALERIRVSSSNEELLKKQEAYMVTQEDIDVRIADSYEAGEVKGRLAEKKEMAKAMLLNGLDVSMISNISGLSEEEIRVL